jgi:hypothetical protein
MQSVLDPVNEKAATQTALKLWSHVEPYERDPILYPVPPSREIPQEVLAAAAMGLSYPAFTIPSSR